MQCPKCNGKADIKNSRMNDDNIRQRRRWCSKCDYKYNTLEVSQSDWNAHNRVMDTIPKLQTTLKDLMKMNGK